MRVVRDITELTMVVLEALDVLQEQALRSHGWSMLLWNREEEEAKAGWWPAWEDTLSNLVCAFLREHLAGHKPVINREVEIWPARIDGSRTDVHVQAADPRDGAAEPLTVVIEVKGCWNPEIRTGVTGQLLPYLRPRPGWAGIFLVGYFHSPGHEHPKYKGAPKDGDKPANRGGTGHRRSTCPGRSSVTSSSKPTAPRRPSSTPASSNCRSSCHRRPALRPPEPWTRSWRHVRRDLPGPPARRHVRQRRRLAARRRLPGREKPLSRDNEDCSTHSSDL